MPQTSPRPIDLGVIAPGLGDTCDDYVRSYRHDLEKAVAAGEGGVAVSRRFARSLDGLLSALSCAANAAADSRSMAPSRVALVAVGGYGRGLVGLHSDIDVLFLCEDPDDPNLRGYAEGLLYPLWDLGLSIGHAVRGVQETLALAREDISTATTLLDLRCVSGDRKLVEELKAAAFEHVFQPSSTDFIAALAADTRARHRRYGSSVFLLEPEVKLGRGGLRDLDVTEWIAKARWGGAGLDSYVRSGALLQREAEQLESAREFLWRVRNFLHLRNSRRHDRLTFAAQEDVAEQLGFVDGITLGVEQFMQAYYRHGRVVAQTMDRMFERSVPFRRGAIDCQAMGDGTLLFGNHVTLEDSNAVSREPILAMRLYQRVLAHGRAPHRYARDSVAQAADDPDWCERLREDEEARRIFRRLLSCVPKLPVREQSMLFELHDVGLLLAMVPEFGPLTGRVQYDDYHVYTTDIHAVRAVDELRSLIAGDRKRDLPIACRLAAEAPRKDPLFLAALLHDIGTARGVGPSHRTRGAESTLEIAERLGISKVDGTEAAWLVRQNLDLFHWAMRRDTTDPEVMAAIAKEVGTEDRLRALLLFTVAVVAS
ncbi:MAG: [protein-PII] uridylyltransferase, partial [Myxococcota bacterium]